MKKMIRAIIKSIVITGFIFTATVAQAGITQWTHDGTQSVGTNPNGDKLNVYGNGLYLYIKNKSGLKSYTKGKVGGYGFGSSNEFYDDPATVNFGEKTLQCKVKYIYVSRGKVRIGDCGDSLDDSLKTLLLKGVSITIPSLSLGRFFTSAPASFKPKLTGDDSLIKLVGDNRRYREAAAAHKKKCGRPDFQQYKDITTLLKSVSNKRWSAIELPVNPGCKSKPRACIRNKTGISAVLCVSPNKSLSVATGHKREWVIPNNLYFPSDSSAGTEFAYELLQTESSVDLSQLYLDGPGFEKRVFDHASFTLKGSTSAIQSVTRGEHE